MARSQAPVTVMQRDGQGLKVDAELVSGNYFDVLGVEAAVGRILMPADDVTPGTNPVVVLSYEFWRTHYAASPGVVGQTIRLNDHPFEVIGVAQQGFRGVEIGYLPAIFATVTMKAQITPTYDGLNDARTFFLHVFGRLKPGIGRQSAQAGLKPYYHALLEEDLDNTGGRIAIVSKALSGKATVAAGRRRRRAGLPA